MNNHSNSIGSFKPAHSKNTTSPYGRDVEDFSLPACADISHDAEEAFLALTEYLSHLDENELQRWLA